MTIPHRVPDRSMGNYIIKRIAKSTFDKYTYKVYSDSNIVYCAVCPDWESNPGHRNHNAEFSPLNYLDQYLLKIFKYLNCTRKTIITYPSPNSIFIVPIATYHNVLSHLQNLHSRSIDTTSHALYAFFFYLEH